MSVGPLSGRTVVTTREEPGELDRLLAAAGADVLHVPLIEVLDVDTVDEQAAIRAALAELGRFDWLVVTSAHGARRFGSAAGSHPRLRLAAVGTRTAGELRALAGRVVDVVPKPQTAAGLLAAMPAVGDAPEVLLAQANRAGDELARGLTELGYSVQSIVGYRTLLRAPTPAERASMLAADVVAFASGSAAQSWAAAVGTELPRLSVAIGPTTAGVAGKLGLQITHVAADHSIEGLVTAVIAAARTDS